MVGACGFDSIPSDLGASLIHKHMNGPVNQIETYLEVGNSSKAKGADINFGTWQSAIYGFAHSSELKVLAILLQLLYRSVFDGVMCINES